MKTNDLMHTGFLFFISLIFISPSFPIIEATHQTDNEISRNVLPSPYMGKMLWLQRINISYINYDMIVVDPKSIYVMGDTSTFHAYLARYDDGGKLIWERSWKYPSSFWDISRAAVVLNNSIYVVGDTGQPLPTWKSFIRSYDYNGTELFNKTWRVTDKNITFLSQSVYSATLINNSIYIAGTIQGNGSGPPAYGYLAKFNDQGDMIWNRTWFISMLHSYVTVTSLNGKLYVLNEMADINGTFFSLHSFDESGTFLWEKNWTYGGSSIGAISSYDGYLYIGGADWNKNYNSTNAITIKLDSIGNVIWYRFFGWAGTLFSFYFTPTAIYISGGVVNTTDEFNLVKYDFNGTLKSYVGFMQYGTYGLSIDGIGDFIYQILSDGTNYYLAKIVDAPAVPQNITATASNRTVTLKWTPPTDFGSTPITNYTLYRGINTNNTTFYKLLGNITDYVDINLINGNRYYYQVAAVSYKKEGSVSGIVSAMPLSIPYPPSNLSATLGNRNVTLKWDKPSDLGGSALINYYLYRGVTSSNKSLLASLGSSQLEYLDLAVAGGTTYYYHVTAITSFGESNRSNEVNVTMPKTEPNSPRSLTASPGDGNVSLKWLPPPSTGGSPITNYDIYRGTVSGGENLMAKIGNVSSYLDVNVKNGVTYYYQVAAINAIGTGPRSYEASATPTAPVPYIISTSPKNRSTDVQINTSIVIAFSQSMNRSITESAISASPSIAGSFIWNGTSNIITWRPNKNLLENQSYTIIITTTAKSQAGMNMQNPYSFTFATGKSLPPTIVDTNPRDRDMGVLTSTDIVISFSEPMEEAATESAISASPDIMGSFTWDATFKTLTWNPSSNLQEKTKYTITISTKAKSINGKEMQNAYSFTFTTKDMTLPFVVRTDPANETIDRDPSSKISITFSEPMDENATVGAISISPGSITSREWNANSTILVLTASLQEGTTYTVKISTKAKDLSGNAIPLEYTFTFKTKMSEELTTSPFNLIAFVVIIDIVILILLLYIKRKIWLRKDKRQKKVSKPKRK